VRRKTILKSESVKVPDGVTVEVKTRKVTVKGPRGTLNLDLSHLPIVLKVSAGGKTVVVERWFTSGKQAASIRTACTHVNNMIIGVTKVRATALALPSPSPPPRRRTRRGARGAPLHGECLAARLHRARAQS
jgi:ribosomal protein L6P/L9E